MGEQLEMLSKQIEEISHDDNPLDKENSAQESTIEKFTRSCSYCDNKFHWMAELIKHVLTDHKTIKAGKTDPMWYMMGELLGELRDEQATIREENEDFSREMLEKIFLFVNPL